MHFQLLLVPTWCVNGRQIWSPFHWLNFGSSPGGEFNAWRGCGSTVKLAGPTAGSHASLHSSWKLPYLPQPCYPRASSGGKGRYVGSQGGEVPPGVPSSYSDRNALSPALSILLPSHWGLFKACTRRRATGAADPTSPPPRARPRALPLARSSLGAAPAPLVPTPQHTSAAARGAGKGQRQEVG